MKHTNNLQFAARYFNRRDRGFRPQTLDRLEKEQAERFYREAKASEKTRKISLWHAIKIRVIIIKDWLKAKLSIIKNNGKNKTKKN